MEEGHLTALFLKKKVEADFKARASCFPPDADHGFRLLVSFRAVFRV